jgi:hypothetical protein
MQARVEIKAVNLEAHVDMPIYAYMSTLSTQELAEGLTFGYSLAPLAGQ